MLLTEPVPFREALNAHAVKSVLPTTGRTRDIQRLDAQIKRRAMLSATIAIAQPLEQLRSGVDAILRGSSDQATQRLAVKDLWQKLGYVADPNDAGTLKDYASDRRIDLQIETNVATARGAGWHEEGQQADVLDEFPAQELYRATSPKGGASSERDWADRWVRAGGVAYDGRLIARKDDPVWDRLGDPDLFPDGLGNPWPPFAFNSGMRVRDISRDEAVELGVIDADEQVAPEPLDLTADLEASPVLREQWLREAVADSGLGRFDGRTFIFNEGGQS